MTTTSLPRRPRMTEQEAKSFGRYSQQNAAQVMRERGCACQPYRDVYTFNRWRAQGYGVKKGEKAIRLPTVRHDLKENPDTETYEMIRHFSWGFVFCRHQVQPWSAQARAETQARELAAHESQEHRAALVETLAAHPGRDLVKYVARSGEYKGELHQLTTAAARALTGADPARAALADDTDHVRWEYVLDQLAGERGLEDGQAVKYAAEEAAKMLNEVQAS